MMSLDYISKGETKELLVKARYLSSDDVLRQQQL